MNCCHKHWQLCLFTATAASTSKPSAHTSFPCVPGVLVLSILPPLPCETRSCRRALVTACRGQQAWAAACEMQFSSPAHSSKIRACTSDLPSPDGKEKCDGRCAWRRPPAVVQECLQLLAARQEPWEPLPGFMEHWLCLLQASNQHGLPGAADLAALIWEHFLGMTGELGGDAAQGTYPRNKAGPRVITDSQ